MRKYLVILFAAAFISTAGAQTAIKLGHINSQELIEAMPESDSAQKKIEKLTKDLQSQLETMQVELNNKYQDYLSKRDTYSDLIKQTKENELQELNQRIQTFSQNAEQDLQKQRSGLYKPILDKANKAIADVSKENGFTYIFDLAGGLIIYHAENSTDILPLVKAKLGLK
ncbi:MAG TPA: OmpH family outer membrane protein [Bacteroidales bacterium]|nr:OmpH family outer membrane protein [Bacteroidales bacterium]